MPAAGESVTVSGFVKDGPLGLQLTEAAVRRDGKHKAALEPAEDVDAERLLAACRDNDIVDASLYGKPVRIRGHVVNSTEDVAISGRIMLECIRKNISVDVAHLPQAFRESLETGSQLEVLNYVAKGFNNTEIAKMVGIGRDCVKAHLSAAFTRLDASSRSEAVAIAIRLGILQE